MLHPDNFNVQDGYHYLLYDRIGIIVDGERLLNGLFSWTISESKVAEQLAAVPVQNEIAGE